MTLRRTDAATPRSLDTQTLDTSSPLSPIPCGRLHRLGESAMWRASCSTLRRALTLAVLVGCLVAPHAAQARSEYDPQRAGNPLKIVYYAVYPAAFLVDVLIFRPAYYIGQWEPFHTLFGTTRPPQDIVLQTDVDAEDDEDDDS